MKSAGRREGTKLDTKSLRLFKEMDMSNREEPELKGQKGQKGYDNGAPRENYEDEQEEQGNGIAGEEDRGQEEQDVVQHDDEPELGWSDALGSHTANPREPARSGENLYALDRWWKVSKCETRIMGQFEEWVRGNAVRAIDDVEREFGSEHAAQMRSAYLADRSAGLYNWDGRHCRTAKQDIPGLRQLLFLLLRRAHPKIDMQTVVQMFETTPQACGMALRLSLGNSSAPSVNPSADGGRKDRERGTEEGPREDREQRDQGSQARRKAKRRPQTLDQ